MKPTLISLLAILLAGIPAEATAQHTWHLELSGGKTVAGLVQQSSLNTDGGWNLGIGIGRDLPGGVRLFAHGVYHNLRYVPTSPPIMPVLTAPQSSFWGGGTVEGNNSSLYEGTLELRVISSGSAVAPYLSIQSGVYVLDIGDIVVTGAVPRSTMYGAIPRVGETLVKGYASLGLGAEVPIGERLALGVAANYARTFDGDYVFLPIISTIGLRL